MGYMNDILRFCFHLKIFLPFYASLVFPLLLHEQLRTMTSFATCLHSVTCGVHFSEELKKAAEGQKTAENLVLTF